MTTKQPREVYAKSSKSWRGVQNDLEQVIAKRSVVSGFWIPASSQFVVTLIIAILKIESVKFPDISLRYKGFVEIKGEYPLIELRAGRNSCDSVGFR